MLVLTGCQPNSYIIEPCLRYTPQQRHISCLPSPFPPITDEELAQEWGRELRIAQRFARDLDLYRAITSYKRALFLLPPGHSERELQIQYGIVLAYYLGAKYQEAIETFECSDLVQADPTFPAFGDLMILLHDAYLQDCGYERAEALHALIHRHSEETAMDLDLSRSITEGEVGYAQMLAYEHRDCETLMPHLDAYCCCAKSPRKAQTLNALLPGAGYAYVGQRKTAMTSFLLNTLTTIAAVQLFNRGHIASGILLTSLEAGWYFGGINGAGLAAKYHNERLWESHGRDLLCEHKLFPVLMFEHSF